VGEIERGKRVLRDERRENIPDLALSEVRVRARDAWDPAYLATRGIFPDLSPSKARIR
jgi:hypothetical protein